MAYYIEAGTGRIVEDPALLSSKQFMDRWPVADMDKLNALRVDGSVAASIRGQLETLKDYRSESAGIDPNEPIAQLGVASAYSLLVAVGHCTSQEAADRIAVILAPVPPMTQNIPLVPPTIIG